MYQPGHFVETDAQVLAAVMRAAPLATLVHAGPDGPAADLIPLELAHTAQGTLCLRGHVARANPLWRQADGQQVLVLFQGPQAYVSPGWYPSKAEHGKVVPTWNYTMVQARGPLRAVDDEPWVHALVSRLTDHHESQRAHPWAVADAPAEYRAPMRKMIVGIEIAVERLEGKFKQSQNRPAADRAGVVAGLRDDAAAGRQPEAGEAARAVADADARHPGATRPGR